MASPSLAYLYQLQNTNYQTLNSLSFHAATVDDDDSGLTASQLSSLTTAGKAVLSYLSIGEAESYRSYWKQEWNTHPPEFFVDQNPDWGSTRVKFWDAEWQSIVIARAVAMAKEGYSGLSLDVVDVYTVQAVREAYHGSSTVEQEMIKFVSAISEATKAINPAFKIIPNSGLQLLTVNPENPASATNTAYLAKIDGVLSETTFKMPDGSTPTWSEWNQQYLDHVVAAGKTVIAIDYPASETAQQSFITQAAAKGYIPFVGNRNLDGIDSTNYEVAGKVAPGELAKLTGGETPTTPPTEVAGLTLVGTHKANTLTGGEGEDTISGLKGNDTLRGNGGKDTLDGGNGNDSLTGGAGDDVLSGGAGRDLFIFGAGSGDDVIQDFSGAGKAAGDLIQLSTALYASKAEILAHISYAGGNAVIDLGGGDSITLANITAGALTGDDFVLVA